MSTSILAEMPHGFVRVIIGLSRLASSSCIRFLDLFQDVGLPMGMMGPVHVRLFSRNPTTFQFAQDPYMLFPTGVFPSPILAVASLRLNCVSQYTNGAAACSRA